MVPHITMLDIENDGVGVESAIMKHDKSSGDIYFIRTDYLDDIDYNRLYQILLRGDAKLLPLWDLLSTITLPNGINALQYFHQYVQVKTESGKVMRPNIRRAGIKRTLMSDAPPAAPAASTRAIDGDTTVPPIPAHLDPAYNPPKSKVGRRPKNAS